MKRILRTALFTVCMAGTVSMMACSKNGGDNTTTTPVETTTQKKVSLSAIHEAVKAAYGDMYDDDMMRLDAEYIAQMKTISADLYTECIVEIPEVSYTSNEFMAFKAAEGKADELENALENYRNYLIKESFQYPTNRVRVQASQIIRHGDYMFFVLLGRASAELEDSSEAAVLKECQEQVKIGVDIINGFFS